MPRRTSGDKFTFLLKRDEKLIHIGGTIIGLNRRCWAYLVGRDTLFIPKSVCEVHETEQGDRFLKVQRAFIEERKGVFKGIFYNDGED